MTVGERYVDPTEQLVAEVFVRDARASLAFYRALGFGVLRDEGTFVELAWEGHRLFLDQRDGVPPPSSLPAANLRVMVPDVDRYWALTTANGLRVVESIGDRGYGIRDFTIADPDGYGVRFATWLARPDRHTGEGQA